MNPDFYQRAISFGDGIFETMYFKKGLIYAFDLHYQRLEKGAKILKLDLANKKTIINYLKHKCSDFAYDEASLKIVAFRSAEHSRGYLSGSNQAEIHLFNKQYKREKKTVNLSICNHRLSLNPALCGIKHCNRLDQVLARNERGEDGLMLGQNDELIETTSANLFIYKDNQFFTAKLNQYGVKGCMRKMMIKALKDLNLPIFKTNLSLTDIKKAEQIIICNSLMGVVMVNQIDNLFHSQNESPIFKNQLKQIKNKIQQIANQTALNLKA